MKLYAINWREDDSRDCYAVAEADSPEIAMEAARAARAAELKIDVSQVSFEDPKVEPLTLINGAAVVAVFVDC